uniref:Uncharacterized protein n=1 Tax=viral metagenome TaxID=1070528 RepID=A0A6C0DC30_9ZZZZ
MEHISRFSKFLSKICCNNTNCVETKNGFQKCNDDFSQEQTNDIELNKSVHIDNNITNEHDIFEPYESSDPSETDELKDPINVDDFDEYHNNELTDSDDEFTNVVIQQCE